MRRIVAVVLVQLLLLGCAIASEQTNAKTLVIDVYSVKASGVAQEKGFALWARDLREGKASLTQYPKILHAEYPLGEAFDIANEAQPEDDVPKLVVAGHVAPRVEQGAYNRFLANTLQFNLRNRPVFPARESVGVRTAR